MNILRINLQPSPHFHHRGRRRRHSPCNPTVSLILSPRVKSLEHSSFSGKPFCPIPHNREIANVRVTTASFSVDNNEGKDIEEYLAEDGVVYKKTLRLVECSMFAAVSGLAFLLSNSLAIERYFAWAFALPIVLSTMRWGIAAGRKTMVATAVLLFVLSGPVKAITYLLLHGLLGLAMGISWRLKMNWSISVLLCALVRAVGALGNVAVASYFLGENILALITINVHAIVTYLLSSMGIISVPSMSFIYFIFGFLLLINCASFVFLLHILYAVFFTKLGKRSEIRLPNWLNSAL